MSASMQNVVAKLRMNSETEWLLGGTNYAGKLAKR